ncbi:MAG: hypothetical protein ACT4O9_05140 [Blastocatellia bacterium]
MKTFLLITLAGFVAVIAVSSFGALASRNLGFDYSWLIPISIAITAGVGFAVSKYVGLIYATFAGALIGLVNSTIGWYISWKIGPGDPQIETDALMIISVIIMVVSLDMIIATIGGLAARIIRRL